jgi:outer membrane protein
MAILEIMLHSPEQGDAKVPSKRCCRATLLALLTLVTLVPVAHGQTAASMTLEEAIALARRNNPEYLQQANDMAVADWAVRDAYGSLLPGASVSTTYGYQAAGAARFGIFTGSDLGLASSTDYYSSSYQLGMSYRLSGAALLAPGQAKSQRTATAAGIEAAAFGLTTNVTRQYIAVKRAQDGVTLARTELSRTDENLRLADARVKVGAAIPLESKQAEVERGRAEVALLQAENLVQTERLRLMQMLGVRTAGEVVLTTEFVVQDVPWSQAQLISLAEQAHPQIRAARAHESAAQSGVKMARSAYLPSLNFSAGISGYARQAGNSELLVAQARQGMAQQAQSCVLLNQISAGLSNPLPGTPADCSGFTLSDDAAERIRQNNRVFPFNYSRDPYSMSLTVSLPLFDGFSRERQVEQARVAQSDASLRVRAEELRIQTEVATALHNVTTARRSAELEARNAELADEQLRLARERYRVGSAAFIELSDAETMKARADRAYLTSVYQFHESLAALEAAVGRPLMQTAETR